MFLKVSDLFQMSLLFKFTNQMSINRSNQKSLLCTLPSRDSKRSRSLTDCSSSSSSDSEESGRVAVDVLLWRKRAYDLRCKLKRRKFRKREVTIRRRNGWAAACINRL